MKKNTYSLASIFFIFLFLFCCLPPVQAQDLLLEEVKKKVQGNLSLVEDFSGLLEVRVHLEEETSISETELKKNRERSMISRIPSFFDLLSTDEGRLLKSLPWIYLPPDYRVLQQTIPRLTTSADDPWLKLDDLYQTQLVGEATVNGRDAHLLQLKNPFYEQMIWVGEEFMAPLQIEIYNAAQNLVATIRYRDWRFFSDLWLPQRIEVFDRDNDLLMEVYYRNWTLNTGLSEEDFAAGFVDSDREIKELKKLLEEDPQNHNLLYRLALLYGRYDELGRARQLLEDAVQISERLEYYRHLISYYRRLGEAARARDTVQIALEAPGGREDPELLHLGARFSMEEGSFNRARSLLEEALELETEDRQLREDLFWVYRNLGQREEEYLERALELGEKLIELAPRRVDYYLSQAELLLILDREENALEYYQLALELDRDQPEVYIPLARHYEERGELAKSEELLREAVNRGGSWWHHRELGDFYFRHQEYSSAEQEFRYALALSPRQSDLTLSLGRAIMEQGREEEALELWMGAIGTSSSLALYLQLSELLLKYGLKEEAQSMLEEASQLFTTELAAADNENISRLIFRQGLMAFRDGDREQAQNKWREAVEIYPLPEALLWLAECHLQAGEPLEARSFWQQTLRAGGDRSIPLLGLGLSSLLTIDLNEALFYFRRYHQLYPETEMEAELANLIASWVLLEEQIGELEEMSQREEVIGEALVHQQEGSLSQAQSLYNRAFEDGHHQGAIYFYLGLNYLATADFDRAEKAFNLAQLQIEESREEIFDDLITLFSWLIKDPGQGF